MEFKGILDDSGKNFIKNAFFKPSKKNHEDYNKAKKDSCDYDFKNIDKNFKNSQRQFFDDDVL